MPMTGKPRVIAHRPLLIRYVLHGRHFFHYVREDNVVYLCMADESFGLFAFLCSDC